MPNTAAVRKNQKKKDQEQVEVEQAQPTNGISYGYVAGYREDGTPVFLPIAAEGKQATRAQLTDAHHWATTVLDHTYLNLYDEIKERVEQATKASSTTQNDDAGEAGAN